MRALTARGRAVSAAGLLLAGAGWGFGQPALAGVAALLVLLPVLGVIAVRRSRYLLGATRTVLPERFAVGHDAEVRLLVENGSRLPTGSLLILDHVPEALGSPTRLVLDRVPSRAQRIVRYPITGLERGRTHVGPLSVMAVDPFGMATLTRSFTASNPVLVTPQIVDLGGTPSARMVGGHGESRSRSIATRGDDDLLPREHRPGDDVRRIHWRATARSGELMVRREERAWRATASVVLDDRRHAHRGAGADSTFEWAVSAAASIAVHYLERGWRVVVLSTSGRALVQVGTGAPGELDLLLESLADARLHDVAWGQLGAAGSPQTGSRLDTGIGPDATTVVAVLGDLADDPSLVLPPRGSGSAVCLAHAQRADREGRSAAELAPALSARGWRIASWSTDTDLAQTWQTITAGGASPAAVGGTWGGAS